VAEPVIFQMRLGQVASHAPIEKLLAIFLYSTEQWVVGFVAIGFLQQKP